MKGTTTASETATQIGIPKPLTPEMESALRAPLPPEAVTAHPTKAYLSNIKGIYITERLNDVFGIGAWAIRLEDRPFIAKMAIVKVIFTIPAYNIYLECFGGNDNVDAGDALKGSTTDAMSKIGSFLQIGADVYKGLQKAGGTTNPASKPQEDARSWISDQQVTSAIERIKAAKDKKTDEDPKEILTKAQGAFRISKANLDKLEAAIK